MYIKYCVIALFLTLLMILSSGCTKTIADTKIKYVYPEIPTSILTPCDSIQNMTIGTNGELLMAYISLQSSYIICASKVISINSILNSYTEIYTNKKAQE